MRRWNTGWKILLWTEGADRIPPCPAHKEKSWIISRMAWEHLDGKDQNSNSISTNSRRWQWRWHVTYDCFILYHLARSPSSILKEKETKKQQKLLFIYRCFCLFRVHESPGSMQKYLNTAPPSSIVWSGFHRAIEVGDVRKYRRSPSAPAYSEHVLQRHQRHMKSKSIKKKQWTYCDTMIKKFRKQHKNFSYKYLLRESKTSN